MADVSFPQINTYQSQFQPTDFSMLANLPNMFWQGQEQGRQAGLRSALGSGLPTTPDGSIDWAKAASIVGQFDPELGMRTAAYAQKNDINPYQAIMAGVAQQNANTNAARANKPSSAAMTQSFKAEDERDSLKATITNLEEAQRLLSDPGGIYEGGFAPVQTELGSQWNYGGVPEKLGLTDPVKAQRSQAFQQIVSPEAMKLMAEQLKGSTAYQELLEFKKIWANPQIPNSIKQQQLARTVESARRHLATKEGRIQELRGGGFNTQDEAAPAEEAPSPYSDGQTATNPSTGEKMIFQNGSWVPLR